jgi:hypothetical protein
LLVILWFADIWAVFGSFLGLMDLENVEIWKFFEVFFDLWNLEM